MKIGIVVENYEEIPHETEQINAYILKRELEGFGVGADILYFKWLRGIKKNVIKFGNNIGQYDCFYLSGKISNFHFVKILWTSFINRKKIHFRIPSYRLDLFKKFRILIKFLIKINLLKVYSFDKIHKQKIKEELGIVSDILEPCVNLPNKIKKLKKTTDILFIGSGNDKRRGLAELLKSIQILKKHIPNVKLTVISRYGFYDKSGNWADEMCRKLKISENVFFKGKVKNIWEEYQKTKVYVLPVKDFRSMPPIPYSILESLYFGTPVVATDNGGINLILKNDFLVDKNLSEKELSEKILWVLKNKPKVQLDEKFLPKNATKKFLNYVNSKSNLN